MTKRLNQVIAVEKTTKNTAERELTAQYHKVQKPALFFGIEKTYQPADNDGEQLPGESQIVQLNAEAQLGEIRKILTKLFDVVATKDSGNMKATANVVVDGVTILTSVPVTFLLFLEKQLINIRTDLTKFPIYDTSEIWTWNGDRSLWETEPTLTSRSKKIPRNHVKAAATDKHPAQVDVYYEDVQVGKWRTVKFSGALSPTRQRQLLNRVEKLLDAVKMAREEANSISVEEVSVGDPVFDYLFAG